MKFYILDPGTTERKDAEQFIHNEEKALIFCVVRRVF